MVMNNLGLALFVSGASLIATTPADTATPTEGAIIPCELASNQRMANFRGAETLGDRESAAQLFFCLASKTTDNASLQSDLLKAGKRWAEGARKVDPNFHVTEWPGDK
jgi:hypothetical protein